MGKAEVDGVEVALSAPLTQRLDIDASYSYTDSEITTGDHAGLPLSDQPRHLATLGLDWQVTKATRLWSQARYQSETMQIAGRGGLSDVYPEYAMVDVGASHQVTDRFTVYGGVYNLLDKRITTEAFGRVLDGRRFNIGARLFF